MVSLLVIGIIFLVLELAGLVSAFALGGFIHVAPWHRVDPRDCLGSHGLSSAQDMEPLGQAVQKASHVRRRISFE